MTLGYMAMVTHMQICDYLYWDMVIALVMWFVDCWICTSIDSTSVGDTEAIKLVEMSVIPGSKLQ